jgi:hypothetical protein
MIRISGSLAVAVLIVASASAADRPPSLVAIQSASAKLRILMRELPPPDLGKEPPKRPARSSRRTPTTEGRGFRSRPYHAASLDG